MDDHKYELMKLGFEQAQLYRHVDAAFEVLATHMEVCALQRSGAFSFEQAALLGRFAEATNLANADMFTAVNISNEELLEKQQGFFAKLFGGIKQTFQKNLDYIHLSMQSAGELRRELKACREAIAFRKSEMDNPREPLVTKVKVSRYLHAGKEKVTSGPDYIKRFDDLADAVVKFTSAIDKVLKVNTYLPDAMFAALRDGEETEWMADNFDLIRNTIEDVRRIKHLNVEERTSQYTIEATDGLLGDAQIVVSSYNGGVNKADQKSIVDAAHFYYAYLYRSDKFKLTDALPSSSIEMEFTIADLERLCGYCEYLLINIEKMLTHQISKTMNNINMSDGAFWFNSYRDHTKGKGDFGLVFKPMKLSNRIAALLFDATASIYNFGSGNIEKAISIMKQATK